MERIPIKIIKNYYVPYIPPRCRKERYREEESTFTPRVCSVTSKEAPLAFRLSDYRHVLEKKTEIRTYKGKLYIKDTYFDGKKYVGRPPGQLNRMISYYLPNHYPKERTKDYVRNQLIKEAKQYLVIDGFIWKRCGEPRYVINTFGLGHNHGGTGLFVETFYNNNISKNCYFSALEGDKAVAKANETAKGRGDTEDVGKFKTMIRVLIPELVKLNPQKEHGEGDPFINALNTITMISDSAAEAGVLAIAMTAAEISK